MHKGDCMDIYIKRLLEDKIQKTAKSFPVVLVCGPRQVGKTTILEKIKINNNAIPYHII